MLKKRNSQLKATLYNFLASSDEWNEAAYGHAFNYALNAYTKDYQSIHNGDTPSQEQINYYAEFLLTMHIHGKETSLLSKYKEEYTTAFIDLICAQIKPESLTQKIVDGFKRAFFIAFLVAIGRIVYCYFSLFYDVNRSLDFGYDNWTAVIVIIAGCLLLVKTRFWKNNG